jgi:hypothetical protein
MQIFAVFNKPVETAGFDVLTAGEEWTLIDQSVWRLSTGWTVLGSKPGGDEFFRALPDRLRGPPTFLCNGYRDLFPGRKAHVALC